MNEILPVMASEEVKQKKAVAAEASVKKEKKEKKETVSYTHLTLPTILLV